MRVLIAVEDSTYGHAIAEFVSSHKWEPGSQFKVLHAIQTDELGFVTSKSFCCGLAKDFTEERDRRARSLVKGLAAQIQSKLPGVLIEEQIVFGKPKEVILDVAEEWKAQLIVVGSHGRTGFSRFMLGSVSLSVLSQAPCSVMIVKLPAQTDDQGDKSGACATKEQKTSSAASAK